MYARMLPQSLGSAVWVVNQTTLPQLLSLTIDVGTGGSAIGLIQQIGDTPFMSLLGRPIIITEKVAALGSAQDVNFLDFGYYLLGDRQAVSMDTSPHSRFMQDEFELRIIERVDGRPWIQSALTPVNGDTISPVVSLAA
jgi:HK97 family phage major capsid protein